MAVFAVVLGANAAVAAAGTYTWSQPADVTSSAQYGVQSWSYAASAAALSFSSGFIGNGQTLAGYTNNPSAPTTWIAAPTSGTTPPLEMVPAQGQSVTLTWTSPFSTTQTVNLSGSINEPNQTTGLLSCVGTTWNLTSGSTTLSGSAKTTTLPNTPITVPAGGTVVLTVTDASSLFHPYSTKCQETDVRIALSVAGTAPTVTITTPADSSTGSTETFAGTAGTDFGDIPQVTVNVCTGTTSSCDASSAVQTMTAAVQSDGSWTVTPATQLPDGTYTVQAEQDDLVGDAGLSAPITFTLQTGPPPPPPTVTLNSFGDTPLTTATPTLSGTAGTDPGDSGVQVRIFSGASVSGNAVEILNTTVDGSGNWAVQATPLANGTYSAIAGQLGPGGVLGLSAPITFTIDVPVATGSLTLVEPASGASVFQSQLLFAGSAANAPGDSSTVTVTLWEGASASGTPVGSVNANSNGSTWSTTWPSRLALGLYTVEASQATTTGTATTPPHTFLLIPSAGLIGRSVVLNKSRVVSIAITCQRQSGQICTGTVLIYTSRTFQPNPGGPRGALKLMFAYVSIPSGHTLVIRRGVSRAVWRTLRHKRHVKLHVTVFGVTATRTLKIQ